MRSPLWAVYSLVVTSAVAVYGVLTIRLLREFRSEYEEYKDLL